MKEFGLSKQEIINQKKEIEILFQQGKTLFSSKKKFKFVIYFTEDQLEPGVRILFSVFKKSGNAVWRNRIKRLMRELYRTNKKELPSLKENQTLLIACMPFALSQKKFPKVYLNQVKTDFVEALKEMGNHI